MKHASLNMIALFGISMCCGSGIHGLTVTRASMVKPRTAIGSTSGVFSWWFERLLVGFQKEYFSCHMVDIE